MQTLSYRLHVYTTMCLLSLKWYTNNYNTYQWSSFTTWGVVELFLWDFQIPLPSEGSVLPYNILSQLNMFFFFAIEHVDVISLKTYFSWLDKKTQHNLLVAWKHVTWYYLPRHFENSREWTWTWNYVQDKVFVSGPLCVDY